MNSQWPVKQFDNQYLYKINSNNNLQPLPALNNNPSIVTIHIKSICGLFLIQKFIRNLRYRSGLMGPPTERQKIIIDDLASHQVANIQSDYEKGFLCRLIEKQMKFQERNEKTIISTKFLPKLFRNFMPNLICILIILLQFPSLEPNTTWKALLEIIITLFSVFESFYIPIELSFEIAFSRALYLIRLIGYALCIIEVLLNFNTKTYYKGQITTNRKIILKLYLKNQLPSDLITLVPATLLLLFFSSEEKSASLIASQNKMYVLLNLLKLTFLLRFLRINKIFDKLAILNQISDFIHFFIALLQLLIIVIFIAHLIGCFFSAISIISIEEGLKKSWIFKSNLLQNVIDHNYYPIYVTSLYYAFVTMITVGYGDIAANNYMEEIYVIFILIISSITYAYILSRIGSIISSYSRKNQEIVDQTRYINIFLQKMQVQEDIQEKVRTYIQNMHDETNYSIVQGRRLLEVLPSNIRSELYYKVEINFYQSPMKRLIKIQLSDNQSQPEIFQKLFLHQCALPDEIIFKQGDQDSRLFFMKSGVVEIVNEKKKSSNQNVEYQSFAVLKGYQKFGEICFFTDQLRSSGAKSNDFSILFTLDRKDFLTVIQNFSYDKEMFHLIKGMIENFNDHLDSILFQNNYSIIELKCYACNKNNHLITDCPKIHYRISKLKIVQEEKLFVSLQIYFYISI